MVALLRSRSREGGLGFSHLARGHAQRRRRRPVPSRHATREELIALARALRDLPGTVLESIPGTGLWGDKEKSIMADLSLAANRPLNWNVLEPDSIQPELHGHPAGRVRLCAPRAARWSSRSRRRTSPTVRINLDAGFVFDALPELGRAVPLLDPRAHRAAAGSGLPAQARRRRALRGRGPAARPRELGAHDRRPRLARNTSTLQGPEDRRHREGASARRPSTRCSTSRSPRSCAPRSCRPDRRRRRELEAAREGVARQPRRGRRLATPARTST